MEAAESGGAGKERAMEAEEFLQSRLAGGPVPTKDIEDEAKQLGISVSGALKRARKKLGVTVFKEGGRSDGVWHMALPKACTSWTDTP
jgi:hypothetical protein